MKWLGLCLTLAGVVVLLPRNATPDRAPDLLTQIYRVDREARVAMLRDLATREFADDAKKAEGHNEQSREIFRSAFQPYLDPVSQSLADGSVGNLAESWDCDQ